jgi:DNA-3-methyladenine glycosylase II
VLVEMEHDCPVGIEQEAQRFLAGLDDPIATLARDHGVVEAALPSHRVALSDHLGRLTLSIVGQQISVIAALAIFGRLSGMLGGSIDAEALAAADEDELRAVGLSRAKARAVHELGIQVSTGQFDFAELEELSDEDAEARLVSLRGIGPWSAQMFLLRSLDRPDVFPAGDIGLRRAIERLDGLDDLPTINEAAERALRWRPYRSYAAKYLWISYALAVT